jgi:hypothetical protein
VAKPSAMQASALLCSASKATSFASGVHLETIDRYKESLWRLAVNGIPAANGQGIGHHTAYLCGWLLPTMHLPQAAMQLYHHAFWDCPVACAVCQQLS